MFYVYRILNRVNGRTYIGRTSDPKRRWETHRHSAKSGRNLPLYVDIRAYGVGVFSVETIAIFETSNEASEYEAQAIDELPMDVRYNVKDGDGRPTTQAVIDMVAGIKASDHELFLLMFRQGKQMTEIANEFRVSVGSVHTCARRLGVSFAARKADKSTRTMRRTGNTKRPDLVAMNQQRGIDADTNETIWRMYLEHHTAQEVADAIGVPKSTVRGVVNRRYRALTEEERSDLKRSHGTAVRSCERNAMHGRRKGDTNGRQGPRHS